MQRGRTFSSVAADAPSPSASRANSRTAARSRAVASRTDGGVARALQQRGVGRAQLLAGREQVVGAVLGAPRG